MAKRTKKLKIMWITLFFVALLLLPIDYLTLKILKIDRAENEIINNQKKAYGLPEIDEKLKPFLEVADQKITLTIAGDMMFDRSIDYNFRGQKLYDVVSNLSNVFGQTNVSIVNLEGPISPTEIPADNTANNMIFNFPPLTVDVLKGLGINAASLANNHTNNNGSDGLSNTIKVLNEKGITPIGSEAKFNDDSIRTFSSENSKLAIFAINSLEVSTDLVPHIQAEKQKGSYVLVFPHWGTEYANTHSIYQENLAHAWIDAGADFVIGSHPHVIQDAEVYKNRPIFYSLGNLLFDQTFSTETQQGLILKITINNTQSTIEILPTVSNHLKPELANGEAKSQIIKRFNKLLPNNIVTGREGEYSFSY